MNIVMLTNTYLPYVGGIARSVDQFTEGYRDRGHHVLVVAPRYKSQPENEPDVVRLAALKQMAGGGFTVAVPVSFQLEQQIGEFEPDLMHSHHPFLIGDTGLRMAAARGVPLLFTYHTQYEYYTRYAPFDMAGLDDFVVELTTGYCNLCDHVIAPSESVRQMLRQRGVTSEISVVPTGVKLEKFTSGDPAAARRRHDVPEDTFLVGHVSRLAGEKNEKFLARAVARYLVSEQRAMALIVGDGDARQDMERIVAEVGAADRVRFTGVLQGQELVDAYHTMDVFAFASKTETQGMVLVEALAAGTPLVALDAPGAREVVRDGENGRLVNEEDEQAFADALQWVAQRNEAEPKGMRKVARETAQPFRMERCIDRALEVYQQTLRQWQEESRGEGRWDSSRRTLQRQWDLWINRLRSLGEAASS